METIGRVQQLMLPRHLALQRSLPKDLTEVEVARVDLQSLALNFRTLE